MLFGREGQRRIQGLRVAVVGLGGLGSHVAQPLSYPGLLGYVLAHDDVVTPSSLNWLIGAVEADVAARSSKVDVAQRMIRAIQPTATVQAVARKLEDEQASRAIASAELVFGCLDDDLPRLRLTDLSANAAIPYIDLAT